MAYDVARRHRLAVDEVVGDVEQPADERLVAGDALGQPRVAIGRVGQLLAEEAALRADRHDDGVLDHLRLHQAEDLGAEVVAAVGPAQATTGDGAEAQVDALDPWRVDEDLEARPRLRQVGDGRRLELEGHVGVVRRVRRPAVALEVVGPQRRLDVGEVGPQDPVVVEAGDVVERALDAGRDLLQPRLPGLGVGGQAVAAGVEAGLEQLDEEPGDVGVPAQRLLDVVDRERAVALLHVLGVGAEHGGLPPGQAGAEHQRVEPVDLVVPVPDRPDRVLEGLAHLVGHPRRVAQPELVDVGGQAVVELVGPLVDDLDAHRRQGRQHLGQRDRRAPTEDLRAGPRREQRPAARTTTGRCRGRPAPRAGPGRGRRWPPRSPPCRPRGTTSRRCAPGANRRPRRTPR